MRLQGVRYESIIDHKVRRAETIDIMFQLHIILTKTYISPSMLDRTILGKSNVSEKYNSDAGTVSLHT